MKVVGEPLGQVWENMVAILKKKDIRQKITFKIDESIIGQEEAQCFYNQMRQITKDYRTQAMTLYVQSCTRESELLSGEIKRIIDVFPQESDDGFDAKAGHAAFKHYHGLSENDSN